MITEQFPIVQHLPTHLAFTGINLCQVPAVTQLLLHQTVYNSMGQSIMLGQVIDISANIGAPGAVKWFLVR